MSSSSSSSSQSSSSSSSSSGGEFVPGPSGICDGNTVCYTPENIAYWQGSRTNKSSELMDLNSKVALAEQDLASIEASLDYAILNKCP